MYDPLSYVYLAFPVTKNATRTTLAIIIVGVYVMMWA